MKQGLEKGLYERNSKENKDSGKTPESLFFQSLSLRCPAGMADWRILATTRQRDFHSDTHAGQLGREDPAGIRPSSPCRKTGLLSPHFPRISRACVRASPRAFAWAPSFPLSLVVQWDLWRFRHLGCVCMNRPVFSHISAGALGNEGGLKLTAPVAIRGHVRNIFRLVGCRKTPASWCSEPAPRSHARVLLKLCSNRKARLQKEPVPNCDCAGSK